MKTLRVLALGAILALLGACATSEDGDAFVTQNAAEGAAVNAAIGCAVGGLLGYAVTGKGSGAAIGCGAAGAAGAVYGGIDGYQDAKHLQGSEAELAELKQLAQQVRADNQIMAQNLEVARKRVSRDQQKLTALEGQLSIKKITLAQAKAEAKTLRENSREIEAVLTDAKARRDTYVEARNRMQGSDTAALDREIQLLEGQIAELEGQVGAINASFKLSGLS